MPPNSTNLLAMWGGAIKPYVINSVGIKRLCKKFITKFLEPTSLNEAITQAVRCDDRPFELRQEEHMTWEIWPGPFSLWPSSSQSPTLPYVPNQVPTADSPTPMEVDKVGPPLLSSA